MFKNRLEKVYRHLNRQARKLGVSCLRVYDHDLPEFPLCIEKYGNKLHVSEYQRRHKMTESEHQGWIERSLEVLPEVFEVEKQDIFLKLRIRKPGRLGQYQRQDEQKKEFIVEENGLKFLVNLSDYLDTGLFLDHRLTRQLVREQCSGKKVLNLFAYTGSFSVYAAAGGAVEVYTVDMSKTYLDWAQRNMRLNGFDDDSKYKYVQADVLQWIRQAPQNYFDLVILDPPTFSNSKRMDDFLDIQRDHVALINDTLAAMTKGGVLYFSTNFTQFKLEKEKLRTAGVKDITSFTTPFDFEKRLKRFCFRIQK